MEPQDYPEDIDFQKYWLILKRHWLLATVVWLLTITLATLAALATEKTYKAYGKLRLRKQNTTSALISEAGEKISKLDTLDTQATPLDTEVEVIRTAPIVNKTIEALELTNKEGENVTYEGFLDRLGVKAIAGTDILTIAFRSHDPQEAEAVVNQLMESYIDDNLRVNRAQAAAAREFIVEQLPRVEQALLDAEASLRSFKEEHKIVDLDTEAKLAVAKVSELDNRSEQILLNLNKLKESIRALEQQTGIEAVNALAWSTVGESTTIEKALASLNTIDNQLAVARSRFGDDNPTIVNLESEKAHIESLLTNKVTEIVGSVDQTTPATLPTTSIEKTLLNNLINYEVERRALTEELQTVNQLKKTYAQRLNAIPKLEQTQGELKRQLDAAQATYNILIKNLQQVQIAENQNLGNAQIISPAIASPFPVSTSKKVIVVMGIVVGGVFYVVTAFICELLDPSIKTSKELRTILNQTLLGMIPYIAKPITLPGTKDKQTTPELYLKNQPYSIVSEAYRMLYANLRFLSREQRVQTIAVTSSVSQEGRSTVAANLAIASAEQGNRVLLIDADMRHPMQHQVWGLANSIGLSHILIDEAEWHNTRQQVLFGLDVINAGITPPNPVALLGSQRMSDLLEKCSRVYDVIILDTPPLLLVADALTIGKSTDGVLLVARPKAIDTVSATAAQELLLKSGQKVLGLVTNGVLVDKEPDSYFHYAKSYFKTNGNGHQVKLPQAWKN